VQSLAPDPDARTAVAQRLDRRARTQFAEGGLKHGHDAPGPPPRGERNLQGERRLKRPVAAAAPAHSGNVRIGATVKPLGGGRSAHVDTHTETILAHELERALSLEIPLAPRRGPWRLVTVLQATFDESCADAVIERLSDGGARVRVRGQTLHFGARTGIRVGDDR